MSFYLTAKLKVYDPSRRKRAILDRALEKYTRVYAGLLAWAEDNHSLLREKRRYKGRFFLGVLSSAQQRPRATSSRRAGADDR